MVMAYTVMAFIVMAGITLKSTRMSLQTPAHMFAHVHVSGRTVSTHRFVSGRSRPPGFNVGMLTRTYMHVLRACVLACNGEGVRV